MKWYEIIRSLWVAGMIILAILTISIVDGYFPQLLP